MKSTLNNTLLIVDDHKMIVNGLVNLIGDRFETVETAFRGDDAIEKSSLYKPQLVILDYRLPDQLGHQVAREIKNQNRDTKILVYTYNDDAEAVNNMFSANVNGYIIKDDKDEDIVQAVDYILQGKDYFCAVARGHIINTFTLQDNIPAFRVGELEFSPREIEIIRFTCMQMTAKQIGVKLNLSERTIEQYKSSVNKKIGSKNLVGLIKFALKFGIVKLEDL